MRNLIRVLSFVVLLTGGLPGPHVRGEVFTLAVLPDVQQEAAAGTRFQERLQWLADNRAGIPYATAIGNHDTAAVLENGGSAAPGNVNLNLRNTEKYNRYFPLTRYTRLAGTYEPGKIDNACHTFTAGGLDWLVLNLELWARTGAVDWARKVIADHPHHNVIILTHAHMNKDGTIQQDNGGYGDNSAQVVFDRVIKPFANVRLVFCGHAGVQAYRTDTGTQGNPIHEFLLCYHDRETNPTGLVAIDTQKGTLTLRVYCPSLNRDKNDGSARTLTGIPWVQPAAATR